MLPQNIYKLFRYPPYPLLGPFTKPYQSSLPSIFKIIFILSPHLQLGLTSCFLLIHFTSKILCAFLHAPVRSTRPAALVFNY
jgi:hypothetical protein